VGVRRVLASIDGGGKQLTVSPPQSPEAERHRRASNCAVYEAPGEPKERKEETLLWYLNITIFAGFTHFEKNFDRCVAVLRSYCYGVLHNRWRALLIVKKTFLKKEILFALQKNKKLIS
jgi:hypothetical protein